MLNGRGTPRRRPGRRTGVSPSGVCAGGPCPSVLSSLHTSHLPSAQDLCSLSCLSSHSPGAPLEKGLAPPLGNPSPARVLAHGKRQVHHERNPASRASSRPAILLPSFSFSFSLLSPPPHLSPPSNSGQTDRGRGETVKKKKKKKPQASTPNGRL